MTTIGDYLVRRLEQVGIKHVFGVPGDYVLDFMDRVVDSSIELVCNCNELNAGYAADAYSRLNGIGALVVTYGVGGLSALNAVVGAYAEQDSLIVVSGAPRTGQRSQHALMHHLTGDYNMQSDIYRKATVDMAVIANPHSAPDEIDRVILRCLTHKRPVYIELPMDLVEAPCAAPRPMAFVVERNSDEETLAECVEEVVGILNRAKRPVVLLGVELHRFGLGEAVMKLIDKLALPYATTISGKSVVPEDHPLFVGVYHGAHSREEVRKVVEDADCLLSLGVWLTDLNTGGFTARLDDNRMISVTSCGAMIKHHYFQRVWLGDFIEKVTREALVRAVAASYPKYPHNSDGDFGVKEDAVITVRRFYDRLNRFLTNDMILISDTGDSICASPELFIEDAENYIAQPYYLSIGYALPATLGVALARAEKRPVLLIGDGAFQMTAQELSTLMRQKCSPVIFLLNNDGYVIERVIHDGPYNDIQRWKYHRLPGVFGDDYISEVVRTEGELERVLKKTKRERRKLVFIELIFDRNDCSEGLARLGRAFRDLGK